MPFQRILVPVDGSATSLVGLTKAAELARVLGARIFLLHVTEPSPLTVAPDVVAYSPQVVDDLHEAGRDILSEAAARVKALGVDCECTQADAIGPGVPAAVVAEAGRVNADLIVVGTHGRTGLRRALLGSDAEAIVRETTLPVMLVHAADAAR
jgi:nucleotide-binding universal stress UspA family protein